MSWGNSTAPVNSNSRMETLNNWLKLKEEFRVLQAAEREARAAVESLFSAEDLSKLNSGTENVATGLGQIKFVRTVDYSFARPVNGKNVAVPNDEIDKMLDAIEKSMEGGNIIAERLVKWKPELSVTEYKLLSAENKKLVDALLVTKQGSTQVTFTPIGG